MKKVNILSRRILLSIFQKMLIEYIDDDTITLKNSLREFWNNNIDSIKFHASLLTRRPYKEDLRDIEDEIEEMEVMFYFLFHFSNREEEWFKACSYDNNERQRRESISYIQMSDFLENMREGRGKGVAKDVGRQLCKFLVGVTTPSELNWINLQIKLQLEDQKS
jgi:hypothetical protein